MASNSALSAGSELTIDASVSRYGVGISWERSATAVDIDLQAVVVNSKGVVVDAVYYNNLKALKGAVTHSGDEQTGDKAGIDECVWVNLQRLPPDIQIIVFVVAAYDRGHLRDAKNGKIHIFENKKENEVAAFGIEQSDEEVDAVGMLVRTEGGQWKLKVIDEPAQDGRHFVDILEPTLGNLIRGVIPSAPRRMKVAFAMEKGQVLDLPETAKLGSIKAGLGWDVSPAAGRDVDLDVSLVFFSKAGQELGAVYFKNKSQFGVVHSGDNLTGEGAGDDEVISVNLAQIPAHCEQMIFVVNIYTDNVKFNQVSNAYCRIVDQEGSELAKYVLGQGRGERGLAIARFFREPGGARWGFQALGTFCGGKTWKAALPTLQAISTKSAPEVQLRGATMQVDACGGGGGPRGAPPAGAANECCSLQ